MCGSRCAIPFGPNARAAQDSARVVIIDTHPAAPFLPPAEDDHVGDARHVVDASKTIVRPRVLNHPVHTTLPVRISCREISPPVPEPIAAALLGDGLVFRYRPSVHTSWQPRHGGLYGFYV